MRAGTCSLRVEKQHQNGKKRGISKGTLKFGLRKRLTKLFFTQGSLTVVKAQWRKKFQQRLSAMHPKPL